MNPLFRIASLSACIVALTACVSAPVAPQRPTSVPATHHVASAPTLVPASAHTLAWLDDRQSVQFVQNFGGGGVGVGLMLGPLGVAANAAAIRKTTERETAALKGRFTVDPMQRFAVLAQALGLALVDDTQGARLSPYLMVVRAEEERVLLGVGLMVDHAPGQNGWRASYAWQSDLDWSIAEVADGLDADQQAALEMALDSGLTALLALYRADLADQIVSGEELRFVSDFASPRFRFQLTGTRLAGGAPGRVVVRTFGATFDLPATRVELAGTKPVGDRAKAR
jgi:hypothetical protein